MEKCDNCFNEFNGVPFDGNGEPITPKMLEYGKEVEKVYSFCSMRCLGKWEEEHPLDEA
uniref:TRASH domain-containing protein n=1 Tax=viral metagenome TaxID=1070528 RepID=A0A6M3L332_9ZZZZ